MILLEDKGEAILKVVDDGCGMDEQFISERLFKPFDTTKGSAGMGIGAYESRDYIRKIGGSMIIDRTTITVILPLANP